MQFQCLDFLREALLAEFPALTPASIPPIAWEPCPQGMNGDITVNCFRLAKSFATAPDVLAKKASELLAASPDVGAVESVKAFVNITLRAEAVFRDSVADMDSFLQDVALPSPQRTRVLVEYSAPNTNKPQHLGHVRNNTLGMALVGVMRRAGHDMVPVNLINDRGIHICKSMLAYQRCGNGVTPEQAGIKGDHFVGSFYVKFNELLSRELQDLRARCPELADKDSDDLFLETEIGRAAQEMLRQWEAGNPEVVSLWKTMNTWVIDGFNQTYARMGVSFVKTYLESQTYLLGKDKIAEGLAQGVFQKRDDGAVIADLGKLGTKVVLRKDGTSVYITQDIGTTMLKHDDMHPDSMIWVVGDEQNLHFKMLFDILDRMGCTWAKNLHHLSYGMVNLPSGRMKSREGTVVDADDLFDEMHALARAATLERAGEDGPPSDLETRAEIIGMGALKFMLLKFNPKTTILFDPQASLKFEGDTGPYVQYVCARINSIARKAAERGISFGVPDWTVLDSEEEKSLAVTALRYPVAIQSAAEKLDCSILVNYLLDLAKSFNRFYREKPVLNADDAVLRDSRLALCFAIRDILADGLRALTIGVPDSM